MHASRVLVITSKTEGLPMAVLEAVALGRCVLSYKYPTICAVFSNTSGLITGVCENIDDMQQKATLLISNPEMYRKTVDYQSGAIDSLYIMRKEVV
jgi:glycosyltransferase involved in cell wall biosynthesis